MPQLCTVTTDDLRDYLISNFGEKVDANHLKKAQKKFKLSYQTVSKYLNDFKVKRGKWDLSIAEVKQQLESTVQYTAGESLIPATDSHFVPFGDFPDLKKVIASKIFYPIFITGLSGNGKTFGVEQACAASKRDLSLIHI